MPALSDKEHDAVSAAVIELINLGLLKESLEYRLPKELISRKYRRALDK